MGETVRWAQNCLRIFVFEVGKESIPAQSTCHVASTHLNNGEGGWEKSDTSAARGRKIEWQVANTPFANH